MKVLCSAAAFFVIWSGIAGAQTKDVLWSEQRYRLLSPQAVVVAPGCLNQTEIKVQTNIDINGLVTSAKARQGRSFLRMPKGEIRAFLAKVELAVRALRFQPMPLGNKPARVRTTATITCLSGQ